ncbi:MAG: NAD(P)/FAD-dependent oxidoreductase [Candidatus Bathyarchaeota archaeon]|nr:NAD(P)/FAD-dependent oxidoreductase [Candidatus Bathyarchaeota archaeon]
MLDMQRIQCDVLVVGAGPAGSMAARTVAENGVDVIFIEEHPVPGTPVYCAEGLSVSGILNGGIEPVPPFVKQHITTARVYAPNGNTVDLTSEDWTGYTLDRQLFDKALSEKAEEAGAKLMTETKALSVIKEDDVVVGVKAVKDGEEIEFRAKIVIGADGHWSIIRRSSGLARYFADYVTCAQYLLSGLNLENPKINEFWIGAKYAPGGYAWVFPKSSREANVGLGVRNRHTKPSIEYLKDFIGNDPRFRNAKIIRKNGGICPVSGVLDKIVLDGLMLAGDSAGQLIPITGAGIHSGIEAGKMAGRVAAEAVKEGDISAKRLSVYPNEFAKYWGKRIRDSYKVLEMLDKFSDNDLDTLAEIISNEDVLALANGINVASTLVGLIKRSPLKLIQLIRAYLR